MFNGEEFLRIRSSLSRAQLEDAIEDATDRLGRIRFFDRGEFELSAGRFQSFATDVKITGQLTKARRDDEWNCRIEYVVQPTTACWVIAIVGFVLLFFGPLILLFPFLAKNDVEKAVRQTMRNVRDDIDRPGDRDD